MTSKENSTTQSAANGSASIVIGNNSPTKLVCNESITLAQLLVDIRSKDPNIERPIDSISTMIALSKLTIKTMVAQDGIIDVSGSPSTMQQFIQSLNNAIFFQVGFYRGYYNPKPSNIYVRVSSLEQLRAVLHDNTIFDENYGPEHDYIIKYVVIDGVVCGNWTNIRPSVIAFARLFSASVLKTLCIPSV